jgi:hypothetical protein
MPENISEFCAHFIEYRSHDSAGRMSAHGMIKYLIWKLRYIKTDSFSTTVVLIETSMFTRTYNIMVLLQLEAHIACTKYSSGSLLEGAEKLPKTMVPTLNETDEAQYYRTSRTLSGGEMYSSAVRKVTRGAATLHCRLPYNLACTSTTCKERI